MTSGARESLKEDGRAGPSSARPLHCVVAPSYVVAREWARNLGLGRTDWTFVGRFEQLLGLEPKVVRVVFLDGWTMPRHREEVEKFVWQVRILDSRRGS